MVYDLCGTVLIKLVVFLADLTTNELAMSSIILFLFVLEQQHHSMDHANAAIELCMLDIHLYQLLMLVCSRDL